MLLAALALASTSCAPPLQNGEIEVRAGASERLRMLCRFRHGAASQSDLCPEDGQLPGDR